MTRGHVAVTGHMTQFHTLRWRVDSLPPQRTRTTCPRTKYNNMTDIEERQSLLGNVNGESEAEEPGKQMSAISDPTRLLHRIVVLIFMCFLGFGELSVIYVVVVVVIVEM